MQTKLTYSIDVFRGIGLILPETRKVKMFKYIFSNEFDGDRFLFTSEVRRTKNLRYWFYVSFKKTGNNFVNKGHNAFSSTPWYLICVFSAYVDLIFDSEND